MSAKILPTAKISPDLLQFGLTQLGSYVCLLSKLRENEFPQPSRLRELTGAGFTFRRTSART